MANFKLQGPCLQTCPPSEGLLKAAMTSDDNPLLHTTNTYLCLLPLEHANLAAGRELMDGKQPAAEAMLTFFHQFLWSGLVDSLFLLSHTVL